MVILVIKCTAWFLAETTMLLHIYSTATISCRSSVEELIDVYHKQVNIALKNEVSSSQVIAEPKVAWESWERDLQIFLRKLRLEQTAKCGIMDF